MAASRLLAQLREALSDPDELIRRAGAPLLSGLQRNVQAMGLVDTGRLYASLSPGHPDNVSNISGSSGAFGTEVPYAAFVAGKPGQDFMALDSRTVNAALDAVSDALFEDL